MLNALMGGQMLTATELAYCANVSRATASGHLSKLVAARLLRGLSETFQIEINNEGVSTGRLCDPRRLTA